MTLESLATSLELVADCLVGSGPSIADHVRRHTGVEPDAVIALLDDQAALLRRLLAAEARRDHPPGALT